MAVQSGVTWSKPTHSPLERAHWSNAAIPAGRREASMSSKGNEMRSYGSEQR